MTDQALIDQFKAGMDPDSASMMAERLSAAESRATEFDTSLTEAHDKIAAETSRADGLQAQLDKLTAEHKKHVAAKAPADKLRKLAPIAEGKDHLPEDRAERTAKLREMIADADDVEIAFSDGKSEIKGLAPFAVSGAVWKDHALGLMLTEPVDLYGPSRGEGAYAVAGYALLIDGKQVAYTPREQLSVPPGGHIKLADDIWF